MKPHEEGDLFDARYPPATNLQPSVVFDHSEAGGQVGMYETYGEDLEFVKNANQKCVWTMVDGDDGGLYAVAGMRFVNRVYYYISSVPRPDVEDDYEEYCLLEEDENEE